MELLVNDLSLHGQFADLGVFRDSIGRVMRIRAIARRHQRTLYCHRGLVNAQVTVREQMPVAVRSLPRDEQRALMAWLSQQGPFWDDDRQHDGDDWYEHKGHVVTDTAVGEAAHCVLHGIDRALVSLSPSAFLYDPVPVTSVLDESRRSHVDVRNYWEPSTVEGFLSTASLGVSSWHSLQEVAVARFERLRFASDAFEPLRNQPFKLGVAEGILTRLAVLALLERSSNADGSRTDEGHALYEKHFTGDKAWFSDSSNSEKEGFKEDLTFPHPEICGQSLFCPWHGKIKTPQYRIHFSWPVSAARPVYVVYIGPKLTKR
jgi:hypothetical protein